MTKSPKRILIDQDGVLADFEQGVQLAWLEKFGVKLPPLPNGRKSFYLADDYPQFKDELRAIYASQGFFGHLPPITGAIEALKELLQAGHDVRICTAPINAYRHCVTEKFMWVEKHLGYDWTHRIILTKDKTWVQGDILIDDKPEVAGTLRPMWTHWHYDYSYNAHLPNRKITWADRVSWATLLED